MNTYKGEIFMNKLKNKKILICILVAVISAVVASVLIFTFLLPARTTMYVFNDSYEAGTPITGSMLTPVQADSKIVVAGSSNGASSHFVTSENYNQIVSSDDVLKFDVSKGDCLMTSMVSSQASNRIVLRMDATSVAITIPVNNTTGVSSSIKPESRVNVYVTYNSGGTYLLLENVRILSVSSKDGEVNGYTLELNNQQAVMIIDAVNTGTVYCGLTNGEGYMYEPEVTVPSTSKQNTTKPVE